MDPFGHNGQIGAGITTPASIMARRSARANSYRLMVIIAMVGNLLLVVTGPASASHEPVATVLVSADTGDGPTNADSYEPSISDDGAKIAYYSFATDLVGGDTNGSADVFLYDTTTGATTLVSAAVGGGPSNGASALPSISADGTKVAYHSSASDLVVVDGNGATLDVFLYDVATGMTTLVSTDAGGSRSNGLSYVPSVNADGTKVAFYSEASDLVAGDTNGMRDIFVHDTATGLTTLVTTDTGGGPTNGGSSSPSVSADGTRIAYNSQASDLVAGDTNGFTDVFLHDISTGATTRISTDTMGSPANGASNEPAISADGTRIAYWSSASDLVTGDSNGTWDVFVYDTVTGSTTLASVDLGGGPADGQSEVPSISADGTKVAFRSEAADLVLGDNNSFGDIFVYDIVTGVTTLISTNTSGEPTNGGSSYPSISADGARVAYYSNASDLVTGDTNGETDVFLGSINRQPSADSFTVSIPEDTPVGVLGSVTATDADNDPLTFAISAGNGAGLFSIGVSTGELNLVGPLDYETAKQHVLIVSVSDGTHSVDTTATVNVTDVGGLLDVLVDPDANTFDDDDGSIFEADIEWLAAAAITNGCGVRLFCPTNDVTRGQMAAFLVRALDLPATNTDYFSDDDASIFEADINRLAASGITTGCGLSSFCPTDKVTRGQMAAFLVRGLELPATSSDYFTDDETSIFEADINRLAASGITAGCGDPSFCPNRNVTRGQMAAFLKRALG
jgi:dipeptidyl aminopeptidase/acylaminoacyl peptidase